MTLYSVLYTTGASSVVQVEADSPEEARDLADEQFDPPFICAQCSGWGQDTNLELGDEWQQDDSESGVWA